MSAVCISPSRFVAFIKVMPVGGGRDLHCLDHLSAHDKSILFVVCTSIVTSVCVEYMVLPVVFLFSVHLLLA